MILTGKAKEDFNKWYWNEWFEDKERDSYQNKEDALSHLDFTDIVFSNAILIEWLDSVGIYVNTQITQTPVSHKVYFECLIRSDRTKVSDFYTTRQEATKQAIIKANEIYNNRI